MKQFTFQQNMTKGEHFYTSVNLIFKIPMIKKLFLLYGFIVLLLLAFQLSYGVSQIDGTIFTLLLVPIVLVAFILLVTALFILLRPKNIMEFEVNVEGIHYTYLGKRFSFSWFEITGFHHKRSYYSINIKNIPMYEIPILKRAVQPVYDITDFENFIKKNYNHQK